MTHGILATAFREIAGREIRRNGSVKPFSIHGIAAKTVLSEDYLITVNTSKNCKTYQWL